MTPMEDSQSHSASLSVRDLPNGSFPHQVPGSITPENVYPTLHMVRQGSALNSTILRRMLGRNTLADHPLREEPGTAGAGSALTGPTLNPGPPDGAVRSTANCPPAMASESLRSRLPQAAVQHRVSLF